MGCGTPGRTSGGPHRTVYGVGCGIQAPSGAEQTHAFLRKRLAKYGLHIRQHASVPPKRGWQFRRAVVCGHREGILTSSSEQESLDSNHGHEHPVRELRVLIWDILCVLVDILRLDPYLV